MLIILRTQPFQKLLVRAVDRLLEPVLHRIVHGLLEGLGGRGGWLGELLDVRQRGQMVGV